MRSLIIGFVLGVGWLQVQAALPSPAVASSLIVLAVVAAIVASVAQRPVPKIFMLFICGIALGFVWASWIASHYLQHELASELEGRDITIIGTIDSLPDRFERGVRFNFAVERVIDSGTANVIASIPSKLALAWYAGFRAEESQPIGDVQPGERWQLTVRLRRPHGNANPFGFDYEAWLLEQNLRATGTVRADAESPLKNVRTERFVVSFGNVVERSRNWLRERIFAALPNKQYAGVIVALVVGDQRAVDQSDWKIFSRSGISHLISISGLHITMIAGFFARIAFLLWRRSFFMNARLPLILPAQKAAALVGAGVALLYVLLAGFGVPAQRTLYMLSVVAVALWFGRLTSVSYVLCLALGVVVVLDPWAVLWPGFWLSFGAVAVILFASVGRTRVHSDATASRKARLLQMLKSESHTQMVVTLGLVPLTMLLFGQISLVSPIANAVAIPLISFIVAPLALIGSVLPSPLSNWSLGFAHQLVEWLAQGLTWLTSFPAAVWTAPIPAWWVFVTALIGSLWLLTPRGWPVRWLGFAGLVPLALNSAERPHDGQLWVTAFDVGQGMALLIETEHHRLLYDTGPSYSPESDGGNRVILPYLKARGIDALDAVMISHNDSDHSGGALSVFDEISIGWVSSSLAAESAIVRAAPHHRRCVAGQHWMWDAVQFEVVHPSIGSYDSPKWKPNGRSCTLKITRGAQSMLLPGDIEAVQEDELIGSFGDKLRATVLLAPHHGSGTSSTLPFLQAVKPELALFQVGYRNRYHHPKPEVYERYGALGIRRLRSDDAGAISLQFGTSLDVTEYRLAHARYWYGR